MNNSKVTGKQLLKSLTVITAVLTLGLASGCTALWVSGIVAATGGAIAGTAYIEGRLTSTVNASPQQVKVATEKAFKKLNISVISSTANNLNSEIKGKYAADGSSVTVTADMQESGQSKVGIRVGTFGDQDKSMNLYAAICENLDQDKK